MIKIDFHMHTVVTPSDAHFEYSIDTLKKYVSAANLNAIAITNHNVFDRTQFEEIKSELDIAVYPGIEIDIDTGHLLLISDGEDLDAFVARCDKVTQENPTAKDYINVDTLKEIFPDLSPYILIPHYDKSPPVPQETIDKLSVHITAGEVQSPKKFMYCKKDDSKLVPVYFSDSRMASHLGTIPVRQTFLNCGDTSFSSLKSCLSDKSKVALSEDETGRLFDVSNKGPKLISGLNVLLGERSSGKSFTLDRISNEFENVRYIKQFSLVERSEKDDERKFNKLLSDKHSLLTREYLEELQGVVNDVVEIDNSVDERSLGEYLDSLLKYAKESERHDAFSKAKLFSEEKYSISSQKGLKDLIASTENLIENMEFRAVVEKHVSIKSLKNLIVDLMEEYSKRELSCLKKKWINELVSDVKQKLRTRTATTIVEDIDFYDVILNKSKVERFESVVEAARKNKVIQKKSIQGFEVVAKAKSFESAGSLKKTSKTNRAFSEAFAKYEEPYKFLQELKEIEGIEEADYYKYFVEIEYKILNKDGFKVSGGERSEFNLLQEIKDAQKYDMLLIDEPESSFDNLFLKGEVNQLIKDISKNMPVVVVTHNSTVGASIRPDYLLYTKKDVTPSGVAYKVYSGFPACKELISDDGSAISTREVTMGCLEAGETAYNERRSGYENLKN